MENWDHPSPQNQWWENGAFWPSRGFILNLGGGGGGKGAFLFHFILSKIVAKNLYCTQSLQRHSNRVGLWVTLLDWEAKNHS